MSPSHTDTGTNLANAVGQENAVLTLVRKYLGEARQLKRTGKLIFEIGLRDGGVTSKQIGQQFQEK